MNIDNAYHEHMCSQCIVSNASELSLCDCVHRKLCIRFMAPEVHLRHIQFCGALLQHVDRQQLSCCSHLPQVHQYTNNCHGCVEMGSNRAPRPYDGTLLHEVGDRVLDNSCRGACK